MAEAEQADKTTPHRRHPQQNRPPYSNRGRGRLDPHVSKALHNFGVSDLRELLDRKHQQSKSGPPPDPSYSYLKDPSRDNTNCNNPSRVYYKERSERAPDSWSRGNSTRGSRGRGGNRDDKRHQIEKSFIQNPINIKVSLTTSTGERSCKLDEEKKLVDIKSVSNRRPQERRSFRGDGGGGRGRGGRGRSRSEGAPERDSGDTRKEFRGRGGRRMGHGRGRGGYNPRTSNRNNEISGNGSSSDQNVKAPKVATEDNWDDECLNSPPDQNESFEEKEQETSLDLDEICTQNLDEYEPEEYYMADDVPSEAIEQILLQRETEEDLVITSSVAEKSDDGGKRTVKFKLVDKKDDSEAQLQTTEQENIKSEREVVPEDETNIQKNRRKGRAKLVDKKDDSGAHLQAADQEDIKSEQKVVPEEETNIQQNRKKGRANKTIKQEVVSKHEREDKTKENLTVERKPADVSKVELTNENENT